MLKELLNISQITGEPKRRWFSNNFFDLIVWFNDSDEIIEFQLCYDINHNEKAFSWKHPNTFNHVRIDDGESFGRLNKSTPVLTSSAEFDVKNIFALFAVDCVEIEHAIAFHILKKLSEYDKTHNSINYKMDKRES